MKPIKTLFTILSIISDFWSNGNVTSKHDKCLVMFSRINIAGKHKNN